MWVWALKMDCTWTKVINSPACLKFMSIMYETIILEISNSVRHIHGAIILL